MATGKRERNSRYATPVAKSPPPFTSTRASRRMTLEYRGAPLAAEPTGRIAENDDLAAIGQDHFEVAASDLARPPLVVEAPFLAHHDDWLPLLAPQDGLRTIFATDTDCARLADRLELGWASFGFVAGQGEAALGDACLRLGLDQTIDGQWPIAGPEVAQGGVNALAGAAALGEQVGLGAARGRDVPQQQ